MTTIVTRTTVGSNTGKGSPLTHTEVDTNFVNLNTAKLETAAIPLGTLQAPSVSFLNDSDTGIFCPQGGNSLAIVTGGQYAITCSSTQAVGIKTANPQGALQVAGSTRVGANDATDAFLEIGEGATGNRNSYIDIVADTTYTDYGLRVIRNNTGANATSELKHRGTGALNFTTQEAAPIVFNTTNSPRLTILAGGNVGIGTSGPLGPLTVGTPVADLAVQTGFFAGNKSSYSSSIYNLHQNQLCVYDSTTGNAAGVGGAVVLAADCGSSQKTWLASIEAYKENATAGNYSGAMVFRTRTNGDATMYERLRITSGGLVGIGTITPTSYTAGAIPVHVHGGANPSEFRLTTNASGQAGATDGAVLQLSGTTLALWNAENDAILFGTNNGEAARIDSSKRLLVGTSTARGSAALQVSGAQPLNLMYNIAQASEPVLTFTKSRGSGSGDYTIVQNGDYLGTIYFRGADGSADRAAASIDCQIDGTPGANDMPGRLVFSTTADGANSPTERMRITNKGYVATYCDNVAGGYGLYIASAVAASSSSYLILGTNGATGTLSGTTSFIVATNGNVYNTNNSYGAISDVKLKENIVDAGSQWSDLKALQVRKYNFKEGQTHTQIGLIAQEVELVSPGLVGESPDRDAEGNDLGTVTKSVNYSVLYMKAVKALQEAMERIEILEAAVTALQQP